MSDLSECNSTLDKVPKVFSTTDIPHKIIISPEDENNMKLGNLTKEQEGQLLKKIIMQMEKNKLKEAKKKEKEKSFNISLQPISDEEFISSEEEKGRQDVPGPEDRPVPNGNAPVNEESLISFNDKDEMLNVGPLPPQREFMPGPLFPTDGREMRRFSGHSNWRGRGSRRYRDDPMGPARMPVRPPWTQSAPWRNAPPYQQQRDSVTPLPTTGGYQVETKPSTEAIATSEATPKIAPLLNIDDLFQKLVASGLVTSIDQKKPPTTQEPAKQNPPISTKKEYPIKKPEVIPAPSREDLKPRRNTCGNLKPITFEKMETLRNRQGGLYPLLYSGKQCSSCGMRFLPEANMQYRQHLDWHFRQNKNGNMNRRVARSRRWYYSVSDWKNYGELEDLEEREKNYFDQQQQVKGVAKEAVEIPSVTADPESTDECCEVCRDKFDQFFNQDKEEWQLRNAIRMDENIYHPLCYDDYQQSLMDQLSDESKILTPEPENREEPIIPGLEIIIDVDFEDKENNREENESAEVAEVVSLESDESKQVEDDSDKKKPSVEEDGDDDDVILNEVAPIIIVVDDDDEEMVEESAGSDTTRGVVKVKRESLDDGFVEVSGLVSLQNGKQIKMKAEPVDLEFASVIPIVVAENPPEENLKEQPQETGPSQSELLTTMDGNMELLTSAQASVPAPSGNRIKMNISKPLPVINIEKESAVESETPSETYIDPFEPFPEPAALKPELRGLKLTKLPPVRKGVELSGLCTIM